MANPDEVKKVIRTKKVFRTEDVAKPIKPLKNIVLSKKKLFPKNIIMSITHTYEYSVELTK